jgi:probable HAF family extracellular repeat protein
MTTSKRRLTVSEIALLVVPLCALAALFLWNRFRPVPPLTYAVTNLGTLGDSHVLSLNDNGDVAGVWITKRKISRRISIPFAQQPFVWSSGAVRFLNGGDGQAEDINNLGQVTGLSFKGDYAKAAASKQDIKLRGFFWSKGKRQNLGPLDSAQSYVMDLNNKGVVVGWSEGGDRTTRGFVWYQGKMQATHAGGVSIIPTSINDKGDIAGGEDERDGQAVILYANGRVQRFLKDAQALSKTNNNGALVIKRDKTAVLWQQGKEQILFVDNDDQFLRSAISNNSNDIVGNIGYGIGANDTPCLFFGNRQYDLNTLIPKNSNWVLSDVGDLNNKGQIVGHGFFNNRPSVFLLTPVPHG